MHVSYCGLTVVHSPNKEKAEVPQNSSLLVLEGQGVHRFSVILSMSMILWILASVLEDEKMTYLLLVVKGGTVRDGQKRHRDRT